MRPEARILIVENEENMRRVLRALLRRDHYEILEAGDGEAALALLAKHPVDVVLSDLKMPRMNGLELLGEMSRRFRPIPMILLTAYGTIGSAVEALKQGAFDYLTKPFDSEEIRQVIAKAVRTRALQDKETLPGPEEDPDGLLVGESAALLHVKRLIERVAPTQTTVLISGESGTGKELVARSLHLRSTRAAQPFVKINCAAIPEGLIESELFGYEKGAFTGAAGRKPGRFELAEGGTLFLDEIGELPLSAQPKLLRVIQEGAFFRVGGTRTQIVDVRLVVATNRDLRSEVRDGRFREDLYYRLNVVPIELPPLRERLEDLPRLAELFAERFARRMGQDPLPIESSALSALQSYAWPGNIRELENVIERAVVLCDESSISCAALPDEITNEHRAPLVSTTAAPLLRERVRSETRRIEREVILEALVHTHGNVTQAARRLGISRRGLQLKMKELEIDREAG